MSAADGPPLPQRHPPLDGSRWLYDDGDWDRVADWQTGLDGSRERAEAEAVIAADCARFVAARKPRPPTHRQQPADRWTPRERMIQRELVDVLERSGSRRASWPRSGEWHGSCPPGLGGCGGTDRCWVTADGALGCRRCGGRDVWTAAHAARLREQRKV